MNLLTSPYFHLLIGAAGVALIVWLWARRYPRLAQMVFREFDRWSGLAIIVLGVVVFVSGCIGFGKLQGETADTIPTALYQTLQVFAFNVESDHLSRSPWLRTAMLSAVLFAFFIAGKGVMLLFRDSYKSMRLRIAAGHVVICGLGRIGRQLMADLVIRRDPRTIVVVDPDSDNPHLDWARDQGALIVRGDATKSDTLEAAGIHRAGEVFVVTGRDECNIECVIEIRNILCRRGRKTWLGNPRPTLRCHVHIIDRELAEIVRDRDLEHSVDASATEGLESLLDVSIFNALERTARRLLQQIATSHSQGRPLRPLRENEVAHFVLLGFGNFGQSLALKLAEMAHFENGKRIRLTIIDRDIASKARSFISRHARFGPDYPKDRPWEFAPGCDDWRSKAYRPRLATNAPEESDGIEYVCNARYVEYIEVTDEEFICPLQELAAKDEIKLTILACFDDDRQNFATAERLRSKLESAGCHAPIFVWIPRQQELSQLLMDRRVSGREGSSDIIPFGQCYDSVSYTEVTESWSEQLAQYLHLVWMNAASPGWRPAVSVLQQAITDPGPERLVIGREWPELNIAAHDTWNGLKEWERASNRSAAIHAVVKAAAIGFHVDGFAQAAGEEQTFDVSSALEEQLRRMEHYRWVSERLLTGWSYAVERSDVRKTRPQITPWECLSDAEKLKDDRSVKLLLMLIRTGRLKATAIGELGETKDASLAESNSLVDELP